MNKNPINKKTMSIVFSKEEAQSLQKILQAFAEGKTIQQWQSNDEGENSWVDVSDEWYLTIDVDFFRADCPGYRVKPESNYRPFKNADECWAEMQKHQPFGWAKAGGIVRGQVSAIARTFVTTAIEGNKQIPYDRALREYTFADGKPFGIKEGDER